MYYGTSTYLRLLELSDLDAIMEYMNDLDLRKNLSRQIPMSRDTWEDRIKQSWDTARKLNFFNFAICLQEDDIFIGMINLYLHGKEIQRRADYGVMIFQPKYRGKGYGTDATKTICAFGFLILNLNSIELEVFEFNKAGIGMYEKVGFIQVGRKRQSYYNLGKYVDSFVMDLLREDFEKLYPDFSLFKK